MDTGNIWRSFLAAWPQGATQTGVIVTNTGEQIQFCSFLMSENVVLLERPTPDTVGARKIIIPYSKIEAVKITEPLENDVFVAAGFAAVRSKSAKKIPTPSHA